MAAPIFEQPEIDSIVKCSKYLSSEAEKVRARHKSDGSRRQRRLVLQLLDNLEWPLELWMEETIVDARLEITFALVADLDSRGREIICHYDIQANGHENPPWSDGRMFKPYSPHKHIYRPANISFGDLTGLRVAVPVKIGGASFQTKSAVLFRVFCKDMNIAVDKNRQMEFQYP